MFNKAIAIVAAMDEQVTLYVVLHCLVLLSNSQVEAQHGTKIGADFPVSQVRFRIFPEKS